MTPTPHSRRDVLKGPGPRGRRIGRRARHGAPAGPSAAGAPAQIDGVLRQAVDAKDVPGVVAMAATDKGLLYEGAFGAARARQGPGHDARHRLPHRLDDQGDHLGRRHAARRAGQAQARGAGAQHRSGAGLAPGAGGVRRRRRAQAASREAADHPAPPADPHRRVQLRDLGREHGALRQGVGDALDGHRQGRVDPHAAGLRSRRQVGVRRQHRLGRPPRRGRSAGRRSTSTSARRSSRRSA